MRHDGAKGLSLSDFKDHFCCTISVVEVADSGIHWMEPRNLTFSQAAAGVNRRGALGISSHHNMAGANCCYADASCHVLHDGTSLDLLKELLAVDGDKKKNNAGPLRPFGYRSRPGFFIPHDPQRPNWGSVSRAGNLPAMRSWLGRYNPRLRAAGRAPLTCRRPVRTMEPFPLPP